MDLTWIKIDLIVLSFVSLMALLSLKLVVLSFIRLLSMLLLLLFHYCRL